jgi:thiamine kinase-like enzyme
VAQKAELDALLDRLDVTGGRERTVEELPGGLTNHNYRVVVAGPDGGDYVVRRFPEGPNRLDIDRDVEHRNSIAAAEAGVGAPVVDYQPRLGLLVIGYLDGVTYDNGSFDEPAVVERAGRAIRRLHEGPRFTGDFDMFSRQRRYAQVLVEEGGIPFARYEDHDPAFRRAEAALSVRRSRTVPCNNDLLAGNFIDDGDQVWLIDYEYSGNNDACFELGNTSTECDLDGDQTEALVASYFGGVTRSRLARVRLQALVSAYGWSLWGAIQAADSHLDFDYLGWGRERFEKAARGFTSAGFEALLEEVTGDD